MIPLKNETVALIMLAGSLLCTTPAAAESWVMWEMQDSLTDGRRLSKALSLYEGRPACTAAAEVQAKKWQSDFRPNVGPTPVVPSENPPGSQFDTNFVRHRVVCWPVGVNP